MNDGFEVIPRGDYNNDGKSYWSIKFTPNYDIREMNEYNFMYSDNKQNLDEICNILNDIYYTIMEYAQDCYEDGLDIGNDNGYNDGYEAGKDNGYNDGYDEGYNDGKNYIK